MKKLSILAGALALACTMTACGSSAAPAASGSAPASQAESPAASQSASIANPVVPYELLSEVNAAIGCELSYPFAYDLSTLTENRYSIIAGETAQYNFTLDGVSYCFRASRTTEDISGFHDNGTTLGAALDASVGVGQDGSLETGAVRWARWFVGDMQYSLLQEDKNATEAFLFDSIVEELRFNSREDIHPQADVMPMNVAMPGELTGDGTYHAEILPLSILPADNGTAAVDINLYTDDIYDIVDVHTMQEGMTVLFAGQVVPIRSVEEDEGGNVMVNGGFDNYEGAAEGYTGITFRALGGDSNGYGTVYWDDLVLSSKCGQIRAVIDENTVLTDTSELIPTDNGSVAFAEVKVQGVQDISDYLMTHSSARSKLSTSVLLENGRVAEINVTYRP